MVTFFTSIRKIALASVILAGALGSAPIQAQTKHQVAVTNFAFTPKELTIHVGDTVVWRCTQGTHNVNGKRSTYAGNPLSFGNNLSSNWTYSFVFTMAGTYNYQCDPHVDMGMTGKVTVLSTPAPLVLTVNFSGMTPHIGEMFTFYLKEAVSGQIQDSTVIEAVTDASFRVMSSKLIAGHAYLLDFYADHNRNGRYDAPPVDHAWRMELATVTGDATVNFTHNTNFTNIFPGSSGINSAEFLAEMNLYPNPATDLIHVNLKNYGTDAVAVRIVNLTGAVVLTKEYPESPETLEFDITDLSRGVYFLTVQSVHATRTIRFIRGL